MDKKEIAVRIAAEIDRLPPVPATIVELRRAIARPDADYCRVVPLLKKDSGLSADLLKFVNSARYGVGHKVQTLEEAVIFFGMANLSNLVSSVFADQVVMNRFGRLKGVDKYVAHSQQISDAAELLAEKSSVRIFDRQVCSLAGLIHDIGRLVLTVAADADAVVSMTGSPEGFRKMVEHENDLWGVDHCTVGSMICEKWGFPDIFVKAIRYHHSRPSDESFHPEALLIYLAHVASIQGMTAGDCAGALPPSVWHKMGLTAESMEHISRQLFGGEGAG